MYGANVCLFTWTEYVVLRNGVTHSESLGGVDPRWNEHFVCARAISRNSWPTGGLYNNVAGKLRLLIRAIDWLLIPSPVLYRDEGFEV